MEPLRELSLRVLDLLGLKLPGAMACASSSEVFCSARRCERRSILPCLIPSERSSRAGWWLSSISLLAWEISFGLRWLSQLWVIASRSSWVCPRSRPFSCLQFVHASWPSWEVCIL